MTEPRIEHANLDPLGSARSILGRAAAQPLQLAFVVAIFLLIVRADGGMTYGGWTPGMIVIWLIAPTAAWALATGLLSRDLRGVLLGLFAAICLLSSAISDAPWVALLGGVGRWNSAVVFVAGLGCWALAARLSQFGRWLLVHAVLAAAALSGLAAIAQMILKPTQGLLRYILDRPSGFAVNPVYFAAQVSAAAAFFAYRLARSVDWLHIGGFTFFAFLTAITSSRAAVLGVLAAALAAIVVNRSARSMSILGAFVASVAMAEGFQRLTASSQRASGRLTADGLGTRVDMWQFGLRALADRPVLGYGAGQFRAAAQRYYSDEWVLTTNGDDALAAWFDSHNVFVQVAVSFGVVGLILFILFLASNVRRAAGPGIWMAAVMFVSWLLQPAVIQGWPIGMALLGASASGFGVGASGREQPLPAGPRLRTLGGPRWVALALAAVGVFLAASFWFGDRAARQALESRSTELPRSMWMFTRDPVFANGMGNAHFNPATPGSSTKDYDLTWLERSTEFEPTFPLWWAELAVRRFGYGDIRGARVAAERGIELQPNHNQSWLVLRLVAQRTGDEELLVEADEVLCRFGLGKCGGSAKPQDE
jgi:hypothetical protein